MNTNQKKYQVLYLTKFEDFRAFLVSIVLGLKTALICCTINISDHIIQVHLFAINEQCDNWVPAFERKSQRIINIAQVSLYV